jgi:L-serine dehydratase
MCAAEPDMHQNLSNYSSPQTWLEEIRTTEVSQILKWVSCFALAVNEVNAALGTRITAPNGRRRVIPAVLMYYLVIETMRRAKRNQAIPACCWRNRKYFQESTISAAMGGCQAEIEVSSLWPPLLCEIMGGTAQKVLMAAEIAMEHHLGST